MTKKKIFALPNLNYFKLSRLTENFIFQIFTIKKGGLQNE